MLLHRFAESDAPDPNGVVRTPTPDDVDRLRAVVGSCLVTVTVATEPSSVGMDTASAFRLAAGLAEVERRARLELALHDATRLVDRCRRLAVDAIDEPTGRGLALFVGEGIAEVHRLAVEPIERVVLDPTFSTRDLERSVQECPPAVVLRVDGDGAAVLVVDVVGASEVEARRSPAAPIRPSARRRWAHQVAWAAGREATDRRLPLVMMGPGELLAAIVPHLTVTPVASVEADVVPAGAELVPVVRSILVSAHRRALAGALAHLDAAGAGGDALVGVDAVWPAVCVGGLDLVVVDAAFAPAARVDPVDGRLEWVDDPSPPGVIDDLVDELVELTVLTGGRVVFADPGSLGPGRVAGVARTATGRAPLDRLVGVA